MERLHSLGRTLWGHEPRVFGRARKRGNAPHSKRCREIRMGVEQLSQWFMESGFSRLRMYWGHERFMESSFRARIGTMNLNP